MSAEKRRQFVSYNLWQCIDIVHDKSAQLYLLFLFCSNTSGRRTKTRLVLSGGLQMEWTDHWLHIYIYRESTALAILHTHIYNRYIG